MSNQLWELGTQSLHCSHLRIWSARAGGVQATFCSASQVHSQDTDAHVGWLQSTRRSLPHSLQPKISKALKNPQDSLDYYSVLDN